MLDLKLLPFNSNAVLTKITIIFYNRNMLDKTRSYYTCEFQNTSDMENIIGISHVSKLRFILVAIVPTSQVVELHI